MKEIAQQRPDWRKGGFTIVEVLIVIGIIGISATLAYLGYGAHVERARVRRAVVDITSLDALIVQYDILNNGLPNTLGDLGDSEVGLDPWGNPYAFARIDSIPPGQVRKDHSLIPLNTDFDLYSSGKDGISLPPLTAQASLDDIVRANDGDFIGPAWDY